jgi:very-short-patch-repair endonuclease
VDARVLVPALTVLLDRHQERRDAGLPTLSVLSGPVALSVHLTRHWADEKGRSTVVVAGDDPRPEALVDAWTDALARERNLAQDAIVWLAQRLDRPVAELDPALLRKTPFERSAVLQAILAEVADPAAACRWLVAERPGDMKEPGLAARLAVALAESHGEPSHLRVVSALCSLLPDAARPALLVVPPTGVPDAPVWIGPVAVSLARLAETEPRLPLFLAIETEALDHFRIHTPESRARTFLLGGAVEVRALGDSEIARRLDEVVPGASLTLAASIRRLAADGASDRLVELFAAAARATAVPPPDEQSATGHDDVARSAAERFLFERLETLAPTAGLFRLNAQLDIPFGAGRPMEVDLLALDRALAVEVDGYYHFRDADAYRRDRRKDLELQKQGFLVVRILADDVVRRLEEVLDLILNAVDCRRDRHGRGAGS